MDNYSKSLFLISLDHYYWAHVTLFALSNTCSHSGKLNNHYWLITIDYTEWLYPYFVDFQCCIRKHWNFPNMFCFPPAKKVTFTCFSKASSWEKVDLMFPKSYKYFWKADPKWCIFSVQRTFVSGKIIYFVQFVRMRLFYSLSTETHHGSVQNDPFHSEVRDRENSHQFYHINAQVAFWREGSRKGGVCGSAEYVTLMMLKMGGFWRLPVNLPCKYLFLQIPARGTPLTRSHWHSVLSALV